MKRNQFLTSACTMGMCSCAGLSFLSATTFQAKADDEKKDSDWRIGFMQKRFAAMLKNMSEAIDEPTRIKILENVGRTCAKEHAEYFEKFKGNPEQFLGELKKQWAENIEYKKDEKTIRVAGKKQESCPCPFVEKTITPKDFCNCSLGYNKQMFETILGRPVEVKIEDSILRGGTQCTIVVQYS